RIRQQSVIRIERSKKLPARLFDSQIVRNVFPRIVLPEISNWEAGGFTPSLNQFRRAICGTVVDHQPFEIAQRLCAQAVVYTMNSMTPIIGRRENRKKRHVRQLQSLQVTKQTLLHLIARAVEVWQAFRHQTPPSEAIVGMEDSVSRLSLLFCLRREISWASDDPLLRCCLRRPPSVLFPERSPLLAVRQSAPTPSKSKLSSSALE